MEIQPKDAVAAGGGVSGLIGFWYWIRGLRRQDIKGEAVTDGWADVVKSLRDEIERLKGDITELQKGVIACHLERNELLIRVEAFERRYGDRKGDVG